jgi:hypothetical protein
MATKKTKKTTKSVKSTKTSSKPSTKPKSTKVTRSVVRTPKTVKMDDFRIAKEDAPFLSFKITKQTVFWSILLGYVLFLSLWILKIQIDTIDIINQINSF